MAEAVKQEQTEGETVSLDNMKDLKGEKGSKSDRQDPRDGTDADAGHHNFLRCWH